MGHSSKRRRFLRNITLGGIGAVVAPAAGEKAAPSPAGAGKRKPVEKHEGTRAFNGIYEKEYLHRIAFPVGGLGAGMFCLEGTGAVSHMSIRNRPEIYHEPGMFAAICVKGEKNTARVLEGPVPEWKFFGMRGSGLGSVGTTYGLPRFSQASFETKFPFGIIRLFDTVIPVSVELTGWSPFVPGKEDESGHPIGAFEYRFTNTGSSSKELVFSYNSKNFLWWPEKTHSIDPIANGFILQQKPGRDNKPDTASFAIFTDDPRTEVDHCWFRGGWWDPMTMAWNKVRDGEAAAHPPVEKDAPGASLYVPFTLGAGESKTIRLYFAWYVPHSNLRIGEVVPKTACDPQAGCAKDSSYLDPTLPANTGDTHRPWYSSRYRNVQEVAAYWLKHYSSLKQQTEAFTKAFYASTLPSEVIEAVAANLTILKSPTVMRQYDGRLWNWEGSGDDEGSCHGSCTHVWNYAQAIPHLFPRLEKTLRNTEFAENQRADGHQVFRANIPISPAKHDFHSAADGQLGGIMKVYRDWRINADTAWLQKIYPMVKQSMDYCIQTWDPRGLGVVQEPHHNTYDIEFWGPDGMCTSFYLGALTAMLAMGKALKKDNSRYQDLLQKGVRYMEEKLYNGEYFFQHIQYEGLSAPDPSKAQSFGGDYSPEAIALLKKEGPKYQYGTGCLSDGVLGAWLGMVSGLPAFIDQTKITSHLLAVHKYNLKTDLSQHDNPQRPGFALGHDGGLLLCSWPRGGKLSIPFVYSDEVWTGIEYQVASHLMLVGRVQEGLDIVQACRNRYDGRIRNPFNEYECGHWYARALASYGMLQGLTGLRYDAVDTTLHVQSRIGAFECFLSTATGFGTVRWNGGRPVLNVVSGTIPVSKYMVDGKEIKA
ncbi:MAG: GH116 family glycosyl hydrolase [Flavihumibacter sp.]